MEVKDVAPLRTKYEQLIVKFATLQRDFEALRQMDAELKGSIVGYYDMIIRWIDIARAKQDPAAADLCLLNIKESLKGTINEWTIPVGAGTETDKPVATQ